MNKIKSFLKNLFTTPCKQKLFQETTNEASSPNLSSYVSKNDDAAARTLTDIGKSNYSARSPNVSREDEDANSCERTPTVSNKRTRGEKGDQTTPTDDLKKEDSCDGSLHKQLSTLAYQDCSAYFCESYYSMNDMWPHSCARCNVRFGSKLYKVSYKKQVWCCPKALIGHCLFAYCAPCYNEELNKQPTSPSGRTRTSCRGNRK